MTWFSFSTSVTSSPRWAKFSTISRPMNPPPTTTARFGFVTTWMPGVRVHPGLGLLAAVQPLADGPGVRDGPHGEDPGQVDAGQRRPDRGRAGRQHQLVVGLGRDLAGRDVAQVHGLLLRRDGDRLAAGPHVDVEHGAEHLLRRHQQARLLRDHARRRGRAARSSRTRRTGRAPPSGSRPSRPAGAGAPHRTPRPPLRPR